MKIARDPVEGAVVYGQANGNGINGWIQFTAKKHEGEYRIR